MALKDMLNRFAPDFTLPIAGGGRFTLSDWRGNVVIVNFWSAECPWSRRADVMLVYRQLTWERKGVRIVGVASNVNEPENEIQFEAQNRKVKFPILRDPDHSVADLYNAETTPHFFIVDRQGTIRYMGALDDSTHQKRRPKVIYVDQAVSALLDNRLPDPAITPAYGCSIVREIIPEPGQAVEPAAPPPTNQPTPKK
jgi:peroxiredoxin